MQAFFIGICALLMGLIICAIPCMMASYIIAYSTVCIHKMLNNKRIVQLKSIQKIGKFSYRIHCVENNTGSSDILFTRKDIFEKYTDTLDGTKVGELLTLYGPPKYDGRSMYPIVIGKKKDFIYGPCKWAFGLVAALYVCALIKKKKKCLFW
jgi:hypothetical protein